MSKEQLTLFWFRRDLRMNDNAGLYEALKINQNVLPVFIFDSLILQNLQDKADKRVNFIYKVVSDLKKDLNALGSDLITLYGTPEEVWQKLLSGYDIIKVYTNHDYEPYAFKRDESIKILLKKHGVGFHTFKDQCIFEFNEILKPDGSPYTVFTPYSRKWKEKLNKFYLSSYHSKLYFKHFYQIRAMEMLPIEEIGFTPVKFNYPAKEIEPYILQNYEQNRDFPALDGSSHLSLHFRFGTISIREKARKAFGLSEKWLSELIWRDFYMQILANFPHVAEHAFKPVYDRIEWRNNETEFEAWCIGKTGYPIVDAGMRELNSTGFMHNRVRMIVASFLCKHLLIDWRWGEAYFAGKLLDFDLASNNGGWQWAAGSGVDAAPYFRIFNPSLQTERFDPKFEYIKKWVSEFGTPAYPEPIVEHVYARKRCLDVYKKALKPF